MLTPYPDCQGRITIKMWSCSRRVLAELTARFIRRDRVHWSMTATLESEIERTLRALESGQELTIKSAEGSRNQQTQRLPVESYEKLLLCQAHVIAQTLRAVPLSQLLHSILVNGIQRERSL